MTAYVVIRTRDGVSLQAEVAVYRPCKPYAALQGHMQDSKDGTPARNRPGSRRDRRTRTRKLFLVFCLTFCTGWRRFGDDRGPAWRGSLCHAEFEFVRHPYACILCTTILSEHCSERIVVLCASIATLYRPRTDRTMLPTHSSSHPCFICRNVRVMANPRCSIQACSAECTDLKITSDNLRASSCARHILHILDTFESDFRSICCASVTFVYCG
jgi:hypothetical protein